MNKKKLILFIIFTVTMVLFTLLNVSAAEVSFNLGGLGESEGIADTVKIIIFLTVIALAPSILVLMTGFTRIIIVLSFVRNALGLQQTPPNQVVIGLALFLTFFLMSPIFYRMNDNALIPFMNEEITQEQAIDEAVKPLREFMLKQTRPEDLKTFMSIAGQDMPETYEDIKLEVIIPSFIISELKRAFIIGFFIYIPFLVIDLVVASTLMSLGMMMLPPAMVAMPFKLILFLVVDGWGLVIKTLMASFN